MYFVSYSQSKLEKVPPLLKRGTSHLEWVEPKMSGKTMHKIGNVGQILWYSSGVYISLEIRIQDRLLIVLETSKQTPAVPILDIVLPHFLAPDIQDGWSPVFKEEEPISTLTANNSRNTFF